MEKKTIIYIVGGIAVLGIGYYLYTKNKNKSSTAQSGATEGGATEGDATKSATAEDGSTTPEGATPKTGQNIKDLKGKEKGAFRKDTREVCEEKYGKNNKAYRDCKKRVKDGGVAFDGSDIQDQFYSNVTNDFDISFR